MSLPTTIDIAELIAFYEAPLGRVARQHVGSRIRALWPSVKGERVLGLGFAGPYLAPMIDEAERVSVMMPASLGVTCWPAEGPSRSALVIDDSLPLPDASIDRILVVHGLEHVDSPRRVLRELWRVLAPGGRILAVVPNRSGLWARAETTPFGSGRPYSRRQINRLLDDCLFVPAGWSEALFVPPWPRRFLVGSAGAWERIGAKVSPAFSGVILVEAEKRLYQGIPARERPSRVRLLVPVQAAQRRPVTPAARDGARGTPPARRTGSRSPTAS